MFTSTFINDSTLQQAIYRSGTTLELSGITGRFDGDKYFNTTTKRELVWNGTSWQLSYLGLILGIRSDSLSPSDSLTYYFGNIGAVDANNYDGFKSYIPYTGTLKTVFLEYKVAGTAGTTEDVDIAIRINNTTDYYLAANQGSSIIRFNSGDVQVISYDLEAGAGIPVAANDTWAMKMTAPAWVTNPTNVYFSGRLVLV